jgi:uracil-DNA glycosylase
MNLEQTVSQIHGVPFEIEASTFFPMYHPAAALYTSSLRKVMEDDFQKLRGLIDSLN